MPDHDPRTFATVLTAAIVFSIAVGMALNVTVGWDPPGGPCPECGVEEGGKCAGLNATSAHDLYAEGSPDDPVLVIDVSFPGEFSQGHIDGALNIPYPDVDFEDDIEELDREGTYLLYCGEGVRSFNACMKMAEKGFDHAYNIIGGLRAWRAAGYDVVAN